MPEEHNTKPTKNYYPNIKIPQNTNPSRFYAIPLLGFLVKIVILIPVFIEALFLGIAFFIIWNINSLVILFTGKYWDPAYTFFLGLMQFSTKLYLYILGIIDQYPGFSLESDKLFELNVEKPTHPNRIFAIPIIGFIARYIMLIPYYIYSQVMRNGSWVAMVISWFPILVYGKFPESSYEFETDTIRVSYASFCYLTGLKDNYPSFSISMNHQTIKILLIIAGALLTANSFKNNLQQRNTYNQTTYQNNQYRYQYNNRMPMRHQPQNSFQQSNTY